MSASPQTPNPFLCSRLSHSRRHRLPLVSLSLSICFSLYLSSSTTALRKLVNPARNYESTRTSRVENDRSNRAFGTRLLSKIADTHAHTHTHKARRESPTVIRSLLDLCAFPMEFNVTAVAPPRSLHSPCVRTISRALETCEELYGVARVR